MSRRKTCQGEFAGIAPSVAPANSGAALRREAARWESRRAKYGITPAQCIETLREQRWVCAVDGCGSAIDAATAQLDHDHRYEPQDRNGWRGLICASCNLTLGHAQDSIQRLTGCAMYLWRQFQRELARDGSIAQTATVERLEREIGEDEAKLASAAHLMGSQSNWGQH